MIGWAFIIGFASGFSTMACWAIHSSNASHKEWMEIWEQQQRKISALRARIALPDMKRPKMKYGRCECSKQEPAKVDIHLPATEIRESYDT